MRANSSHEMSSLIFLEKEKYFWMISAAFVTEVLRVNNDYQVKIHGRILNSPVTTIVQTNCRLNEFSHTIDWKILISTLGMSGYVI